MNAERIYHEEKSRMFDEWLEVYLEEHADEVEAEENRVKMSEEQ